MKTPRPFAFLVCLVALATSGLAQKPTYTPTKELTLLVQPTLQYRFNDVWHHTPPGFVPQTAGAGRIVPGQTVNPLVFILDPTSTPETFWTYDITVTGPADEVVTPGRPLELFSGVTGEVIGPMYAKEGISWQAKADCVSGERIVHVVATDADTGRTVQATSQFVVVATDQLVSWEPIADYNKWFMNYYQRPTPHELPAYLAALTSDPEFANRDLSKVETLGASLGFFATVWQDNPWLQPILLKRLGEQNDRLNRHLAGLIAYTQRDDRKQIADLSPKVRQRIEKFDSTAWPEPFDPTKGGVQLDVLWGRFFAGGHLQPVQELVAVLDHEPSAATDAIAARMSPILVGASMWSLNANALGHRLLRAYLVGMMSRPKTTPQQKTMIEEVLRSKDAQALRSKYMKRATAPQTES